MSEFESFRKHQKAKNAYLDVPKLLMYNMRDESGDVDLEFKKYFIRKEVFRYSKYVPNLKHPKTFNEKLNWYKLYYRDSLMTKCVDKYSFKDYVETTIGPSYTNKTFYSVTDADDFDFNELPTKFVMKLNSGSGSRHVKIIQDKSALKTADSLKIALNRWLTPFNNVYWHTFDWAYKDIEPRVIFEEFMEDRGYEYDFFCFYGEPKFFYIADDSSPGQQTRRNIYDMDWNLLPVRRHAQNIEGEVEKPKEFEEMVEVARALSKPFPHVRVDLCLTKQGIKAIELTFYTGSGFHGWTPGEWDGKFGELFELPDPSIPVE